MFMVYLLILPAATPAHRSNPVTITPGARLNRLATTFQDEVAVIRIDHPGNPRRF